MIDKKNIEKKKKYESRYKIKESFKSNYKLKKFRKISIIFLLLSYKIFSPINKVEKIEENIEDIFPRIYNESNEKIFLEKYFELCQNGILVGKSRYKRNLHPKISVIIPVYNRENYIKRVLRSIQNQSYKNIEIIFVDDASQDNSVKLIKEYQRKDKRIRLIKHKKNKGTLITRNDGAMNARGEYITFVDTDDLLYEGILKKLSGAIEMYDSPDVIRFDAFFKTESFAEKYNYGDFFEKNIVITQPKIFKQTFYDIQGELFQHNLFLWGKIIKRKLFYELLDNLTDFYKRQHWTLYEDNAIDFVLLKYTKSYVFINENGYIYCYNEVSAYTNRNDEKKTIKTVKDVFSLAEICFDYTNDNEYEKQKATFQLKRFIFEYRNSLETVTEGFDYYFKVLNKFSKCKSILPRDRAYLNEIKNILENAQNKVHI